MLNRFDKQFFIRMRLNIKRRRNQAAVDAIDKSREDMKLFKDIRLHIKLIWVAIFILALLQFAY